MSIKSDKWIRMMATEYGMIEPYEPGQVKMIEGKRIVSYGTSSYGYDIRCADEFKLFTNINSTIVDPKEFGTRAHSRILSHPSQRSDDLSWQKHLRALRDSCKRHALRAGMGRLRNA